MALVEVLIPDRGYKWSHKAVLNDKYMFDIKIAAQIRHRSENPNIRYLLF